MSWGLYDPDTHTWWGNDDGPKLFEDEETARAAATVLYYQLEEQHRVHVREYDGTGRQLAEVVAVRLTPLEALRRAEKT